MLNTPVALDVPLRTDSDGVIRIGESRVTLHTLISFYRQGEAPESLHDGFSTIPLADIYAVIAYYLAHQSNVDTYLRQIDAEAETIRQEWERRNPPPTKAELLTRLEAKKTSITP